MDDPDKQKSSDNKNVDTTTGSGSDEGSNLGDTMKEKKVRSVQKDEGQLQDPFDDHMHILLENNNDSTTSTTPASGLSSRSYSPANDGTEGQCTGASGHMMRHLLPDVPANSPMETQGASMMMQGKHQELPSFNSIEMVQKIREKKSSYDGGDDEISQEVSNYPYTPTNSYTESSHMAEAAKKYALPNFMNTDIMQKIEEKKALLENIDHSSEGVADFGSCPGSSVSGSCDAKTDIVGSKDSHFEQLETASRDISDNWSEDDTKDEQSANVDAGSVDKDDEILSEGVFQDDGTEKSGKEVTGIVSDECASSVSIKQTPSVTTGMESEQEVSDQSADNSERKLTVMFSSNNLSSSARAIDGNQRRSQHRVLFTDDLHDNAGVSSFSANSAKPSSYKQVDVRSKVTNVIGHDQARDMTSEHVDTQAQGFVIYASSDKEAAQKFTESVIKTAVDEYKSTGSRLTTRDIVSDDVISRKQNSQISQGVSLIRNVQNAVAKQRDNVLSPQTERTLYLGFKPGESSTDDDANADGQDKAMDFVQDVIHEAVEVCRREPDGSTDAQEECLYHSPDGSSDVPELNKQPTGGSTDNVTPVEEKDSPMKKDKLLTAKQRHHLQDVQKTLNISLDFSSEDEEEIKALKDQIPEDLISADNKPAERPTTLNTTKKKIMPSHDLLNDTDMDIPVSPVSTDDDIGISVDDEKTPDDLTTPDVLNNSMFDGELDWQSTSSSTPVEPIPEYTAREELEDERHWRSVQIGEKWYKIDMKVIEPYKKVLSHGGYYGDGFNAIVVFTACYLPDRRRRDYHYVMDNLFLYVISTLELLVVEDYMIVYFHGATPRHKMPSLRWLKRCYDMIDRRLRKNLKGLLVVHPTIWLKTLVFMMKPFVSSKFSSKLRYIKNLEALTNAVPTEYIYIPDEVQKYDSYWSKSSSKESASST